MHRRTTFLLLLVAPLLVWLPTSDARERPTDEIVFTRDVTYGRVGDEPLLMNLARPKATSRPVPAVLVFHGGAWSMGHRRVHDSLVRWLARRGLVAATVGYRLAPRNPWPAQIEDAKCAVRHVRANAKSLGVDPDRIAAMGFSAGAHLAQLLGTLDAEDGLEGTGGHAGVSSKANLVISWFGPSDLHEAIPGRGSAAAQRSLDAILGPAFQSDRSRASPVRYVDRRDAPMLLLQGTRDRLVPHEHATRMLARLHDARVEADVVLLVGAGHGWGDPRFTDSLETAMRFLDRHFRPDRRPRLWREVRRS